MGPELRQCSVSYNARKGTLRGMHYQDAPHEEHKLVRCTAGAIFDVIVDIRKSSPTYRRWYGDGADRSRIAARCSFRRDSRMDS